MVTVMTLSFFLASVVTMFSNMSPVKFMTSLMFMSAALISCCFLSNSSAWMGSIYFMIFIGGIMVMFMILSSLLPNEKSSKLSKYLLASILVAVLVSTTLLSSGPHSELSFNHQSKALFVSNGSFETLIMVILLYFFTFVFIVSKQNSSLRSFLCQRKEDFVILHHKAGY